MGTTKDNLQGTNKESKTIFENVRDLVRKKKADVNPKDKAATYVDHLEALDRTLNDMITAKAQDVKNEPSRKGYNDFVLAELKLQDHLLQQIMESAARCAEYKEH